MTACIVERVRDAAALLVLDGCEHVLLEARAVVAAILAGCPRVRVLATSREALRLQGEARADVGPFELPCGASATARELASSDAVQLFADRARDARPGFALTAQSAVVIADICRRLDGLALPIERAAGRLRVMGLEDLRRRLDAGVATLVRADRPSLDALAPLMTLIDWSYELLNEDEKLLLRQLAVFRGGSPLPAAVAVGAREGLDETTVTDVLQALVDKSVVRASFPNDHPRYDVLETVREYALAALARSGGLSATRSAHAEFFATMAHGAGRSLRESEHLTWLRRLEPEHGNLWAALSYARAEADAELAVRLGAGLGWYFALANLHAEGRSFLEQALSVPTTAPASPERVAAHAELCHLADLQLDRGAAIDAGNRGLALAHGLTAPRESALVRTALALALINGGRRRRAAALLREARADFEAVDDDWGVVGCELVAAVDAMNTDNAVAGAALSERILKRAGATGYLPYLVWGLLLEGWSAQRRGDGAVATRAHRRALDAAHELGLPHYVAFALAELGARACADGDLVRAELLQRRAVSIADRAQVGWFDAHARVRLAATLVRKGEPDAARALYRVVVDRTQQPRDRHAREAFFAALAGSPAAAAVKGLAELS